MTDDKLDLDFSKEKAVVNTKDESIKAESKDSKPSTAAAAATSKKSHKKSNKASHNNKVDDATETLIQQKVQEELAKQKAVKSSGANTKVNIFTPEGEENKSAPAVNPAGLKQKKQTHPFIPEGESNPSAPPAVF